MAVSARRATIAERKARRQLIISLVAAVLIGLVFVFVVVPLLFSVVVSIARQGRSVVQIQGDVVPPQRPVLQPPPEFTSQSNLELTGFTEPQAEARLYLDYSQQGTTKADEDGAFHFALPLSEGEHELWIIAVDEAGNQSGESPHYLVTLDKTAPTITLDKPEDGAVFTLPRERVLTVQGVTSEPARVKVNGAVVQTGVENAFSLTIQLASGSNEIILVAVDEAGNTSEEKKVTVEYRP